MTIKFTCYVPQDIGTKLKDLQTKECLNISKFITQAIVEHLKIRGKNNENTN